VPVNVCGNAVAAGGFANANCKGGSTSCIGNDCNQPGCQGPQCHECHGPQCHECHGPQCNPCQGDKCHCMGQQCNPCHGDKCHCVGRAMPCAAPPSPLSPSGGGGAAHEPVENRACRPAGERQRHTRPVFFVVLVSGRNRLARALFRLELRMCGLGV
jgi:hypothetical protein